MEIKVKVCAKASKAKIIKEKNKFLVYVKSEKIHNMANDETKLLISKYFGVSLDNVSIKRGLRSENKTVEIT